MPSKELMRQYSDYSYYHVYNRGVAKQNIFIDHADKVHFMTLVERYMNPEVMKENYCRPVEKFNTRIDINAYCLMDNHFHLLIFVKADALALSKLMRLITLSYVRYFNIKYSRKGPLLESRFKAKLVEDESYLIHLSRYIHLNPVEYMGYAFSSLRFYLGDAAPPVWLKFDCVVNEMSAYQYLLFIQNYESKLQGYMRTSQTFLTQ